MSAHKAGPRRAAPVIVIGLLHIAAHALADDRPPGISATKAITLEEAVRLAVRQNPTILAGGIDIRIGESRVHEASGIDDFLVDASLGWLSSHTPHSPGSRAPSDQISAGIGLARPLPTGGKIGLTFGTDYALFQPTESTSGSSRLISPSLLLTLSHPLLKGAGTHVARADQRRAQSARDIAVLQREATLAGVLRDVCQRYWELAFASAELNIRRASLELGRDQLRAVQANIDVEKQPTSAAAEVDVAIALREEELLVAEQNLRYQSLDLRRLLGLELQPGEPMLLAAEAPGSHIALRSLEEIWAATIERNPELQMVRAQVRAAAIEIDVAQNGLLPQLDFAIAAGPVGNSPDAKAFSQMGGFEGYTVQAGLVFSQFVGRRTAEGRATAARETLRKSRLAEADLAIRLRESVLRAVDLVAVAEHRCEILDRATGLAQLDLEAKKARFESGRGSSFDVLRPQEELARARLRQARARTDYVQALAALDSLTSEILQRYQLADH